MVAVVPVMLVACVSRACAASVKTELRVAISWFSSEVIEEIMALNELSVPYEIVLKVAVLEVRDVNIALSELSADAEMLALTFCGLICDVNEETVLRDDGRSVELIFNEGGTAADKAETTVDGVTEDNPRVLVDGAVVVEKGAEAETGPSEGVATPEVRTSGSELDDKVILCCCDDRASCVRSAFRVCSSCPSAAESSTS